MRTLADTLALAGEWAALELPARGHRPRPAGRRLALFAWALPPSTNPGVYRPLSFLRHAAERNWTVDAFCGEAPANQRENGEELLRRVPNSVRVHTVAAATRRPAHRLFPRIDGGFPDALAFAKAAIRAMRDEPPDVVLASGPPFFAFVAALLAARHFRVPLVLDYRDEWTECPFEFVQKAGHDRWWERRCLRCADAVVFTTESHRTHQLRVFDFLSAGRTHVVANGWEPMDFPAIAQGDSIRRAAGARLTIAHVGTLSGHTPPEPFLASLASLIDTDAGWRDRLRVQFVGRRSPEADAVLRRFSEPGMLEVVDHVAKGEAARRMLDCDILLLFCTEDLARYLPGKLFDYVAAGRPILLFGHPGEASRVVESLAAGELCPPGSAQSLGDALDRLSRAVPASREARVRQWLDEHRRERQAERMFAILEQAVSAHAG